MTSNTGPKTPELKPCPFCGGAARLWDGMGETWAKCEQCTSTGRVHSNPEAAIDAWNKRSND